MICSTDGNRKAYRQCLGAATPPCIPYLGVYLTDLTFLEEGNPDFVSITVRRSHPLECPPAASPDRDVLSTL